MLALSAVGCDGGDDGTGGTAGSGTGGATGGSGTGAGTGECTAACCASCEANKDVASDCIAIVDNSGLSTFGLRMAQLTLEKPAALTNPVVAGLIESGVTMNLKDCNLTGDGTFSWILQFDKSTGKLKTGGAKPVDDPTTGYCFVNEMLGGQQVSPIEVDATPDANGNFTVATGGDVVVPIFLGTTADFVLLPLRDAKLTDGTISADQNCIGSYNAEKLLPEDSCEPSGDVTRFTDAGSLDAYITLEDADAVIINSLKQSLCVLLTGDAGDGGDPKKCSRDANGAIIAKGDWCSTTNSADGCQDAFKLGAKFAASAVKVTGDCQ
ncbi:MAG: hypothetical protein IPK82_33235 [Polyangiaceae bacterium]|nr:hypothetical protein [Polyangiaceae bacterium]